MAIFHCLGDSRLPADSAACRIEGPAQTGSTALLPGACLRGRGCQAALPLPARPAALPSTAAPGDPVAKPSPVAQCRSEAQGASPARSSPGHCRQLPGTLLADGRQWERQRLRQSHVPPECPTRPSHGTPSPCWCARLGMGAGHEDRLMKEGCPSSMSWCGGRDEPVPLCPCPLHWPRWHRWLQKGPGDD